MSHLVRLARHTVAGAGLLLALTVLLGGVYPLAVTAVGQVVAPWQAQGSLVTASGAHTRDADRAVGSALIGQAPATEGPVLFVGRPSAGGHDPLASGGSNLGPESEELVAQIAQRRATVARREGVDPDAVPADAVTASGSGLDPHISPAYAALQVDRVAAESGLSVAAVRALVADHTESRTLGVLGEERVNVLLLNLAVRDAS